MPRMPPVRRPTRTNAQKRGRPPKYGGPATVVAVTLPVDVIASLRQVHGDLGWAIVTLAAQRHRRRARRAVPAAQLVEIGAKQSLIVVDPAAFGSLQGVQLVPLSDGLAFLALDPSLGLPDLEARLSQRLTRLRKDAPERASVRRLLALLRKWRRSPGLSFDSRSILIARQTRAR